MPEQAQEKPEYEGLVREILAFLRDGDAQDALTAIDRLMALDSGRAEGYFLLGLTSLEFDEQGRALSFFEKAAEIDPECFEYAEVLANLYTQVGRLEDGLYFAKLSTTLAPHPTIDGLLPIEFSNYFASLKQVNVSVNYLRGMPAYQGRRFADCLRHFDREVRINPTNADALRDLGDALSELGRYSEALTHLTRAIELRPADAETRFKLGVLCYRLGEFEEAALQHKAALKHDPDSLELAAAVMAWSGALPLALAGAVKDFRVALEERKKKVSGLPPEAVVRDFSATADDGPPARVRVGYLSNHFQFGDQARFVESLFMLHNRAKFEIYMYQQSPGDDSTTQRLRSAADVTRDAYTLDDELLSVVIAGDEIDILVDLCGDELANRSTMLHMHPGRVQVGGWGAGMGIGLPGIDYVMTDEIICDAVAAELAPGQAAHNLDFGLYAYPPRQMMPAVGPLPAAKSGNPVIGVACDPCAITRKEVAILGRILNAVPEARILLGAVPFADREAQGRIKAMFADLMLAGRIDVSSHQSYADQMIVDPNYWQRIDIFVAPGRRMTAATVADALWMGVPVLSLKGERPLDRVAASAVYTAARPEWIAHTGDGLVDKVVAILGDLRGLEKTRAGMRNEMRRALLFNPEPQVRAIERAYLRLLGRETEIA